MSGVRQEMLAIVERLMAQNYASEEELDLDADRFEALVPYPGALSLIFYWDEEFDREPTSHEVVERALSYRPIEL